MRRGKTPETQLGALYRYWCWLHRIRPSYAWQDLGISDQTVYRGIRDTGSSNRFVLAFLEVLRGDGLEVEKDDLLSLANLSDVESPRLWHKWAADLQRACMVRGEND